MKGLVLVFPDRAVVLAYGVLRQPHRHERMVLVLACSVLVQAVRLGAPVPPDALDLLVVLSIWGRGSLDLSLRLRLADALAEVRSPSVQGRALVQLQDVSTSDEMREIARRLLGFRGRPGLAVLE